MKYNRDQGCKCGNKSEFKEVIDKGIKQVITYKDGYIESETTTYSPYEGKLICLNCNRDYDEYDL